jgi:exopolysaccharide/PEP-CTERM locus tyrosine autokinase
MGKMFEALQRLEREKAGERGGDFIKPASENLVLDDKIVSFFDQGSMAAEQFRRLRSHIIKPGHQLNPPKTILVTSAMPSEGKSLISINLAITIAIELHSHALVVDCDFRNPSLSRWFGLLEGRGLSNYLLGEADIPDIIIKTPIEKLSFLCGGAIQDNPVELIGSRRMQSLVEDLKSRYEDRYIIFDSSPLLATTEPSVLNRMVDGIILVVRAGETPRESIQQAIRQLDKDKILGVVLNDLEFKTQALIRRNFGTDRYYYNYRYSSPRPAPKGFERIKALFGKDSHPKKDDGGRQQVDGH